MMVSGVHVQTNLIVYNIEEPVTFSRLETAWICQQIIVVEVIHSASMLVALQR